MSGQVKNDDQRAQQVDRLWRLKQMLDKSGGRYFHFNMMLRDPAYRQESLQHAAGADDPQIRALAEEALKLDDGGQLLKSPAVSASVPEPGSVPPLGVEQQPGSRTPVRAPANVHWAGVALVTSLVILIGGVVGFLVSQGNFAGLGGRQAISGSILEDTVWRANTTYTLEGLVFVESGASLTLEPGTQVLGERGSALIVTRDAKIFARGRKDAPIVFTSAQEVGARQPGDWGGVVLLGNAPLNRPQDRIEGLDPNDSRALYGGSDRLSNCGVLEYVRIEFAGFEVSQDNELNGLTLGGCSSVSVMRYIQVHRGSDDGIEVYGGDANFKHIVITGAQDDGFDWDKGYTGNVQFGIIQSYPDSSGTAFEGDSGGSSMHDRVDPNTEPRSVPTYFNMLLVGEPLNPKKTTAMVVRSGSGLRFFNSIVIDFPGAVLDVRGLDSGRLAGSGALTLENNIFFKGYGDKEALFLLESEEESKDADRVDEAKVFLSPARNNRLVNPKLPRSPLAEPVFTPPFTPGSVSPAAEGPFKEIPDTGSDFFDRSANFIGAVRPGESDPWWYGWTAFPQN